eukprot:CAMPEP_0171663536 /NCGR_PEP_ID=MMETSP0990-20121206/46238_1 /TAXON_ID=483369 /ORGANISM="non described non described, Strain CCMP2098" /LENGTH=31 /DNA_ID= /DNA_START= /DNA_END= /DNA_ORIENTATION=
MNSVTSASDGVLRYVYQYVVSAMWAADAKTS